MTLLLLLGLQPLPLPMLASAAATALVFAEPPFLWTMLPPLPPPPPPPSLTGGYATLKGDYQELS